MIKKIFVKHLASLGLFLKLFHILFFHVFVRVYISLKTETNCFVFNYMFFTSLVKQRKNESTFLFKACASNLNWNFSNYSRHADCAVALNRSFFYRALAVPRHWREATRL